MRLRSLAPWLALSLVGCKTKPTDDKPIDQVDQKTLMKEQTRAGNGEIIGKPLLSPKVVVDAQQVSINGYRVGPRTDLESGGKAVRVASVYDWAKGLREHYKTIHPGEDFTPAADVTLPDDMAFADAVSLLDTLAFAGYADGLVVHSGDVTAHINIAVPAPARADFDAPAAPTPSIVELWSTGGAWGERLVLAKASDPALLEAQQFGMLGLLGDPNAPTAPWGREDKTATPQPAAPPTTDCAASTPVTLETVSAALKTDCGGACSQLVIGGTPKFHDALAMAGAGLQPSSPHPVVAFRIDSTCSAIPLAAPSATNALQGTGKPGKKSPSLRQGSTQVNGRLPPEVIQRIVRQNFGRFRLCYENGLRTAPTLAGTISVKFVIDRTGAVTSTADSGSDLPDKAVVQCVVSAFGNLSFPQPEGGIVTVVYPIEFHPE